MKTRNICKNQQDSEIAKHNENYYFCCYMYSKMVDKRECEKCKYYTHK